MSASLTERERDVIWLVACGLSNKQVGRTLYLSEDTVKTHLRRIYQKLWVHDRASACIAAVLLGIIHIEQDPPAPHAKHARP